ncbi:MAG: HAMP domain-containing histidine kinase [Tissierellia bacterium]|nr:HAMP domain-containing histidine kinase [Tissierellia bacterium]
MNKMKNSVYLRIFGAFLATYIILMVAFTAFLVSLEMEAAGKEFASQAPQISKRTEEILNDNIDNNKQITDLAGVKKEFVRRSPVDMLNGAEAALFTSDYKLIYSTYSPKDYWTCVYTESMEENIGRDGYGLLKPSEWLSKEEVIELENYLYAQPKVEKIGDLAGYAIHVDGFWMDDEMIIPHSISVSTMYARELDEEGNVGARSGTINKGNFYNKDYDNFKNLPYYENGSIIPKYKEEDGRGIPGYDEKLTSKNQEDLRQMVRDQSKLSNHFKHLFKNPSPYMEPVERVSNLSYRYYMVIPYQSNIRVLDDQSYFSEFYTAVGIDINIWERISSTLVYVWLSCLTIFGIAAFILSKQTYKTYLKREEIERQRKETTDALAHDLKTPLSIISGYAQNLQEDVQTEKREHYASNILKSVDRMDKIIHQMLDMTKLESDSFEIKVEEVSLREISGEIINRYKSICDEKFIEVDLSGEAFIKADKSLLERVIDNFFVNAIENTLEGGNIKIEILSDAFEIYNRGNHIPEDIIKDIWLPYKRGDSERSNTKGTGLGLSIARSILELHKFPYGVRNKDKGVTFWFKFKNS